LGVDDRVVADVLALMEPQSERVYLGGEEEAITSLGFLKWLRLDSHHTDFLTCIGEADVQGVVAAMNVILEEATGVSPSRMFVGEALVAFPVVLEVNALQFLDPALLEKSPYQVEDSLVKWKNRMALDFIATLARRFSMQEIGEMQPAFAMLMWQQIKEEESLLLDAVFYSSEMGYKRQGSGKSAKLKPRESPFAPFWLAGKRARMHRSLMQLQQPEPEFVSPFITNPDRVVDLQTSNRVGDGGNDE
jgi:hypothetical protein